MSRSEDVGAKQETVGELQAELGAALRRERIQQRLDQQALAGHAGLAVVSPVTPAVGLGCPP